MSLETETQVDQLTTVEDENGKSVPPANENQQEQIRDRLGNFGGVAAFEYTTGGTAAEALDAHDVPDGVEVVISYLAGNSDVVNVGNSQAQPVTLTGPGQAVTLRVDDTSTVYIQTPTAGDGVGVLFEEVA